MINKIKEASGMISAIGGAIAIIAVVVFAYGDHQNDFKILVSAVSELQKAGESSKYWRLLQVWETVGLTKSQHDELCDLAKKLNKPTCPRTRKKP